MQRYARELVQALDAILDAKPDVKVTIVSPRLSESPPVYRNIELRQVGYLRGHAWEQFELPWHSRGKTLFCPGNTAPVISLFGTQPTVVTVHDLSYQYFPEAYRLSFRLWYRFNIPLVLRRARRVITVSESERKSITAHYPQVAPRLHSIQNGGLPASPSIETLRSADERGHYILYVGSLSKRKNFPRTLEAACRLARKRGFKFVFVGGKSKSLSTFIAKVPDDISTRIDFIGAVDEPSALISYYQKAGCFLFPSLYEASPLPPVEAMACGCPVVVSDIPALRERCGDAAIYCDPYDMDSITATVERVMDDEKLRVRLQVLGRRHAANYSWERCARQTLDIICECAKKRQASFLVA